MTTSDAYEEQRVMTVNDRIRRLSDMYDIFMAFRRARIAAGLPVASPIEGMTNEEFEELRRRCLAEEKEKSTRDDGEITDATTA
jgi:hypothetical protein